MSERLYRDRRQGVIGGTGFSEKVQNKETIQTDYGDVEFGHLDLGDQDVIFIARHQRLQIPSHVNYRANVEALKLLGVNRVISVSAAGRMHRDVLPGHLVNVSDLDWDHTGQRASTFAEDECLILHAPLASLYSQDLRQAINDSWDEARPEVESLYAGIVGLSVGFHPDGTYFNSETPWFNTEAHEERLRNTVPNVKLIGQTLVPEAPLLRELGIAQATIGMCTDHSTYPGAERVSHAAEGGVVDVAKVAALAALSVIEKAVKRIPADFTDPFADAMFRGSVAPNQVDMPLLRSRRPFLAEIIQSALST